MNQTAKTENVVSKWDEIAARNTREYHPVTVGAADLAGWGSVGIHGNGVEGVVKIIARLLDHDPAHSCYTEIDGEVYAVWGNGEYTLVPGARWGVTHGEV